MNTANIKDRYGFTFEERLNTQAAQLAQWKALLQPGVYDSTVGVLGAINAPAEHAGAIHMVPLGSTLASLILSYASHEAITEKALMGELINILPPPSA